MNVAQDLIYVASKFDIYCINDSIFKWFFSNVSTIDSGILLKNHVSCNFMLK